MSWRLWQKKNIIYLKKNKKTMKNLILIQQKLNAPKGQFNAFGKYKYRSCEDILEAVKPLLKEANCTLILSDTLENIGDRYYIKASAKLFNADGGLIADNTAFAREEADKKGMDGSQITGASSSYARKYALNGLFLIDDSRDSDSTNDGTDNTPKSASKAASAAHTAAATATAVLWLNKYTDRAQTALTPEWTEAVKFMQNGGTISQIAAKYKLSKDNAAELDRLRQ
jgi:hypothetical protein